VIENKKENIFLKNEIKYYFECMVGFLTASRNLVLERFKKGIFSL